MISLFPKILRDKSTLIIEKCIAKAFDIDINSFLVYLIDNVDIRILKYLAYQFHILGDEGWNLCTTEKEQRELLKIAIQLHRIKGTPQAVERCIEILNFNGTASEWFEYSGRPHRFKVDVILDADTASEEVQNMLIRYINLYKNKRAVLEVFNMQLYPRGNQYVFPRVVVEEEILIKGIRA